MNRSIQSIAFTFLFIFSPLALAGPFEAEPGDLLDDPTQQEIAVPKDKPIGEYQRVVEDEPEKAPVLAKPRPKARNKHYRSHPRPRPTVQIEEPRLNAN